MTTFDRYHGPDATEPCPFCGPETELAPTFAEAIYEGVKQERARIYREIEPVIAEIEETIREWAAYADTYFQEKWDLEGEIKNIKDRLRALGGDDATE